MRTGRKLSTQDRPALLDALSYIRDGDMLTVQESTASAATCWKD